MMAVKLVEEVCKSYIGLCFKEFCELQNLDFQKYWVLETPKICQHSQLYIKYIIPKVSEVVSFVACQQPA